MSHRTLEFIQNTEFIRQMTGMFVSNVYAIDGDLEAKELLVRGVCMEVVVDGLKGNRNKSLTIVETNTNKIGYLTLNKTHPCFHYEDDEKKAQAARIYLDALPEGIVVKTEIEVR